jgi:hypothetical protein
MFIYLFKVLKNGCGGRASIVYLPVLLQYNASRLIPYTIPIKEHHTVLSVALDVKRYRAIKPKFRGMSPTSYPLDHTAIHPSQQTTYKELITK